MNTKLGTLKNVNLREAWSHEAQDFTPWLADNLEYLSNEIGIQLELEGQEVKVESFSALKNSPFIKTIFHIMLSG